MSMIFSSGSPLSIAGPDAARLLVLPQSLVPQPLELGTRTHSRTPMLTRDGDSAIAADHDTLGRFMLTLDGAPETAVHRQRNEQPSAFSVLAMEAGTEGCISRLHRERKKDAVRPEGRNQGVRAVSSDFEAGRAARIAACGCLRELACNCCPRSWRNFRCPNPGSRRILRSLCSQSDA